MSPTAHTVNEPPTTPTVTRISTLPAVRRRVSGLPGSRWRVWRPWFCKGAWILHEGRWVRRWSLPREVRAKPARLVPPRDENDELIGQRL